MNVNHPEEREGVLLARFYLYSFFSRIFAQVPDADWLESLTDDTAQDSLLLLDDGQYGKLQKDANFLKSTTKNIQNTQDEFLLQVRNEYARLFTLPVILPAPPWETVYRKPLAIQEQVMQIGIILRGIGQQVSLFFGASPCAAKDHVSFELAYMAGLAEETRSAFQTQLVRQEEKLLSRQQKYLTGHLTRWIPQFAGRMGNVANPVIYPGLSRVLADFIVTDAEQIAALLQTQGKS